MINIIVSCILVTIIWALIESVLLLLAWKVLQLAHLISNPYRVYHYIAFFGIAIIMVFLVIKYIDILIYYIHLLR